MNKKLFFIVILAIFIFLGCSNNDSCTTTHSYGSNSFTKDAGNACLEKLAGAVCYRKSNRDDVTEIIAKLQGYEFVFHKDKCRDLNEKDEDGAYKLVECPDFIPESFKFTKLVGCEIYTVDPNTDCDIIGCPKIFFETNNGYFKKMAYEKSEESEYMMLHSQSVDGKVEFSRGIFVWSEKAEDGTEIEKKVSVEMTVADSSDVEEESVPDEDADVEMNDGDEE